MTPSFPIDPLSTTPEPGAPDNTAESSFGDILSQFEQAHAKAPTGDGVGDSLTGTVVSISEDAVLIDVGRKAEGALPIATVRLPDGSLKVKPGDKVDVTVTGRHPEGYYLLSIVQVLVPKDWSGLQKAFEEKATITGHVQEVIKGGLRVDVGARAFMPASRTGARDITEMEQLVGQQVECRITKLDVEKEDVVVDRRVVLEEANAKAKDALLASLTEGSLMQGTVRSLTDFGAFVDLGGVDGLLHVSDISWSRVSKPEDALKVGDKIEVKVLKIQGEKKKISLGMKQLQKDPWTVAAESIKEGDRVRGKVARLAEFGAFIELMPGVDGLIHVSAMSWSKKIRKPSDLLKVGDEVEAVVQSVDPVAKKISLSLKQALGDPWDEVMAKFPVGSVVERPVTSIANFGVFIELEGGIEGMIHVGDITREKRIEHPKDVLSNGQVVKAQVTEHDKERRRLRLSIKALEPTAADHFIAEHKVGDTLSGRVAESGKERAKIDLGEGVTGICKMVAAAAAASSSTASSSPKVDVSALGAMLSAKWKTGPVIESKDGLKVGQVRQFRITSLDVAQKRIDLELVQD
jgi:small subunit ribosomal protein S1